MRNSTQVFMAADSQGRMRNEITPNGLQTCSILLMFACLSAKPRFVSRHAVFTGKQSDASIRKNIWDTV